MAYRLLSILVLVLVGGCQISGTYSVKAMPSPVIWPQTEATTNPEGQRAVWYVTDRASTPVESKNLFSGERSNRLSVGSATTSVTERTKNKSEAKQRFEVSQHSSLGYLQSALPYGFLTGEDELSGDKKVDFEFAEALEQQLEASDSKDIFIYVHGYRTLFENPILLASQLWKFMEYEGAFISFAWPSTPRSLAYFKDLETAQISGHNLRLLLEYLSANTNAERINIIGYSAGTRVVLTALHELALKYADESSRPRVGRVALVASDYDRSRWATSASIGLLDTVEHMNIYLSESDFALVVSRLLLGEARLGQLIREDLTPTIEAWLQNNDKLSFIDVSDAEKSTSGNGHDYFRRSPWASSDLILAIKYGIAPKDRGLVRAEGEIPWAFDRNYVTKAAHVFQQRRARPSTK